MSRSQIGGGWGEGLCRVQPEDISSPMLDRDLENASHHPGRLSILAFTHPLSLLVLVEIWGSFAFPPCSDLANP
jgi:hypothetical protein